MKRLLHWINTDGLLHIETSALLLLVAVRFVPVWAAALVSLSFGIAKEILDRFHGGDPSWHDIICDLIGILAGVLVAIL